MKLIQKLLNDYQILNDGKNIIVTNRRSKDNEQIILAYRSQFNIENVFKVLKNREIGSWWAVFHWTEPKIQIHRIACTIAILLRALALRRVKNADTNLNEKNAERAGWYQGSYPNISQQTWYKEEVMYRFIKNLRIATKITFRFILRRTKYTEEWVYPSFSVTPYIMRNTEVSEA